jgi:hypothetical protein
MNIPVSDEDDANPREVNLLTEHANATIEQIRRYEETYVNDESRERQDMQCLYTCLMASLSQAGRNKVHTDKNQYILKDENGKDAYSGNLLLKVILTKSTVDNRSGAFAIRMELAALPELIASVNYDISKFNLRVKTLMSDLSRRGETSADVFFNLFRAYKVVLVVEFTTFIDRLKDEQDEKEESEQSTEIVIMDKAENKYRVLVKEGTWKTKEQEDNKFLALETQLAKLKQEMKKKRAGKSGGDKDNKGGAKKAKTTKKKVDITRKPKDITKPVTINGSKWWWCSAETGGKRSGALRKHQPSECKGKEFLKEKDKNKDKGAKTGASLKISEARLAPKYFPDTDDEDSE